MTSQSPFISPSVPSSSQNQAFSTLPLAGSNTALETSSRQASSESVLESPTVSPAPAPAARVASASTEGTPTRDPRHATSLTRSIIFGIAGFCVGALSGAGITMLLWQGLKDRFASGVGTQASGTASAAGDVSADGGFNADGNAGLDNVQGDIFGVNFGVPASGSGDFTAKGDLDFNGNFQSDELGLGFDGDANVDIGELAPLKVVLSVSMIFGVVVGAVAWLAERQLVAADDRAALLAQRSPLQPALS